MILDTIINIIFYILLNIILNIIQNILLNMILNIILSKITFIKDASLDTTAFQDLLSESPPVVFEHLVLKL